MKRKKLPYEKKKAIEAFEAFKNGIETTETYDRYVRHCVSGPDGEFDKETKGNIYVCAPIIATTDKAIECFLLEEDMRPDGYAKVKHFYIPA